METKKRLILRTYANIDLNSHPTPQTKLLARFFRFFRRKNTDEGGIDSHRPFPTLPDQNALHHKIKQPKERDMIQPEKGDDMRINQKTVTKGLKNQNQIRHVYLS